jgi:hypothetical protein
MSKYELVNDQFKDVWINKPNNKGDVGDLQDITDELNRLSSERDEARAAIPSGEWVEYADYKRVHDAASRLLVAINKQLPIGIFSLIETEYRSLKDAIYGREGAK